MNISGKANVCYAIRYPTVKGFGEFLSEVITGGGLNLVRKQTTASPYKQLTLSFSRSHLKATDNENEWFTTRGRIATKILNTADPSKSQKVGQGTSQKQNKESATSPLDLQTVAILESEGCHSLVELSVI